MKNEYEQFIKGMIDCNETNLYRTVSQLIDQYPELSRDEGIEILCEYAQVENITFDEESFLIADLESLPLERIEALIRQYGGKRPETVQLKTIWMKDKMLLIASTDPTHKESLGYIYTCRRIAGQAPLLERSKGEIVFDPSTEEGAL